MSRKNDQNFLDQHKILVLEKCEIHGPGIVAKMYIAVSKHRCVKLDNPNPLHVDYVALW